MRIVFFGSPAFGLSSLHRCLELPDAEVVAVVTQPDRRRGRGGRTVETPVKRMAREAGIHPILQPARADRETTQQIARLQPDVGVVAASGHILPSHLLEIFPHHLLNVHGSLLPRHRGASAVAASILAGDDHSGATIMQVVREVDAGPIVGQVRTPIGPLETTAELTERISHLGADLLARLLPRWVRGDAPAALQDAAEATFAPRLTKTDGVIDWACSANLIARQVRAFQPWPLATSRHRGDPFNILAAWPLPEFQAAAQHGRVVAGDRQLLPDWLGQSLPVPDRGPLPIVSCGSGGLALLQVQRAGRQAQPIVTYLNGDPQLVGSRLG